MNRIHKIMLWLVLIAAVLAACGPAATPAPEDEIAPTAPAAEPGQVEEPTPLPPTETPTETAVPVEESPCPPPEPQRIEFALADGTPLVGVYEPPTECPAPGLLLMHQLTASRETWEPLVDILHETSGRFAIFAYDMPEHGESGGSWSQEGTLEAARLAFEMLKGFEGVDPDQIVLIGASVGADAAVDECGEGCVGAVSISPGGYLGIPYNDALAALRDAQDPPVLCIASEGDNVSLTTCNGGESAGLSDYRTHIYEGSGHGNRLFLEAALTPPPPIAELIRDWLTEHLP